MKSSILHQNLTTFVKISLQVGNDLKEENPKDNSAPKSDDLVTPQTSPSTEDKTLSQSLIDYQKAVYKNVADAFSGKIELSNLEKTLNNAANELQISSKNFKASIERNYFL